MSKRFLSILLAAVAALVLVLPGPDAALAKRLGGGGSSGSKSGFSSSRSYQSAPSSPSAPSNSFGSQSREQSAQRPQPLPQSQPGGLAQPAPSRPWGGFLGGMLAGGLIGSMLSGGGHMGGFPGGGGLGLLDMLLIGGGIWLLFRFMRGRQAPPDRDQDRSRSQPPYGQQDDRPSRDPIPMRPVEPETPQAEDLRREAADRYARAQAGWDMLRSQPARQAEPRPQEPAQPTAQDTTRQTPAQDFGLEAPPTQAPEVPAGFDTAEFLRGAKAVYARLQASWDARDLEDIRHFTTPEMFEGFARDAKADPSPSRTELVLVNASLLGVTTQDGQTRTSVLYDVLLREDPRATQPEQVKEIWNFVRDDSGPGANWRLEGIEQTQ
jgi:predicted lipid-binding transport protein (Tim44 family)